jgi:SAM-dependent methyltransferase
MSGFEQQWRERFERFARASGDDDLISGWSPTGLRRRLAAFAALVPSLELPGSARVLDLGCGGGTYVRYLAGLGHRAIGLDYSLPSLERARAADPGPKGLYLAGEAYTLPFRTAAFDLVVSIGVLQTLDEPERALAEMTRVLRPGGALVVEALNRRALVSRVRNLVARARGKSERVRHLDPVDVLDWLQVHGLDPLRRTGIYLPPRRLVALDRLLGAGPAAQALDRSRRLSDLTAHAFLFTARRQFGSLRMRG